jgi:hypothetical protein
MLHVKEYRYLVRKCHIKEIVAFIGTEPIRSKIIVDIMILEQVNTFTYLGCNISYQEERDTFQNHKIFTNTGTFK